MKRLCTLLGILACVAPSLVFAADLPITSAGVVKADITPSYPIRLSGYGSRKTESEGVAQKLWAKALVLGSVNPAILVTVDNCGVPAAMVEKLAEQVSRKHKIPRERLALCSSHTHSAPCLAGNLSNLFSQDIPPEHQATIDRYTRELQDKLEEVVLQALARRKPASLLWAQGSVGFAKNRRAQGGPVDHSLPVLKVADATGKTLALVAGYACHCTTLVGDHNNIHGDWAGFAQEFIERDHPEAIAMITIGCGADANPHPRGKVEHARTYGEAIATEVKKLGQFVPLPGNIECSLKCIELPFAPLPSREQWEERAKQPGIIGYHAKKNLERLKRGEQLPTHLPYSVQTWNFGDKLAMILLPGEVVVDYAVRLKAEFDKERLWVHAYANDVPCYIPSRRILQEGGYEAESSLWYYDRPARLAPETEDLIIKTVHELMPKTYLARPNK